jgi:threonine/homoserine/homoserine lactone efflux protein
MSGKGKGSDPGSGVMNELGNTAVTGGVAVGSVAAFTMIPVVGPFIAIAGVGYLGWRAVKRGLNKSKR